MYPKFKVGYKVRVNIFGRHRMGYPDKRDGVILEVKEFTVDTRLWNLKSQFYYITDGENGNFGTLEEYLELDS